MNSDLIPPHGDAATQTACVRCEKPRRTRAIDGRRTARLACAIALSLLVYALPQAASASWLLDPQGSYPESNKISLSGVSCGAEKLCTAVGHYIKITTGKEVEYAETWNGHEWFGNQTNETEGSSLLGVSCLPTEEWCMAVGFFGSDPHTVHWSKGGVGINVNVQIPVEAKSASLSGVSCINRGSCIAVGHYVNSSGEEQVLADQWNGTKWTLQKALNPKEAKSASLFGVSCRSSEACTAVGHYVSSAGKELETAESWNGKEWTSRLMKEAEKSSLLGVSCASTEWCMAVGYESTKPRAVFWKESSGRGEYPSVPSPKEAKGATLAGVSCPSKEFCIAVGHYVNSSGEEQMLAEQWSSTESLEWKLQEIAPRREASLLNGLSCASTTVCLAVGHEQVSSTKELALAEEYR